MSLQEIHQVNTVVDCKSHDLINPDLFFVSLVSSRLSSLSLPQWHVFARAFMVKKTTALQALNLHAQYQGGNTAVIPQLQSLLHDNASPATQLYAAQVFLKAGMKKEALQAVFNGSSLEQVGLAALIYLQLDRIDLAQKQLKKMQQQDEDSVLTQLVQVYVALAQGSSKAKEALHLLQQLSEQYGGSILLLNLGAVACLQAGQYAQAESRLEQARQEFNAGNDADTLVNLIVAYQYQQKSTVELLSQLKQYHPNHFLVKGLEMVEGAFERESLKYRVTA